MITAGPHSRTSASDHLPTLGENRSDTDASRAETRVLPAVRSRTSICADIACVVLFLGIGASAAFPLVWGLALHQTPLAVSGGCGEAMCLIALLNRIFAPAPARERSVPFLAALEMRPVVLGLCLALMATSAATLITYWPAIPG